MKTYNRPVTQVTECLTSFMLMTGNVSGEGIKGTKDADGDIIIC